MELDLLVTNILPPLSGQSAKGAWVKQDVIFEIPSEFNRKVCIGFMGDRVQMVSTLNVGELVKVSFNIESREFNGKWYTNINAWRVEKPQQQQQSQPSQQQSFASVSSTNNQAVNEEYTPQESEESDLPF